MKIESKYISAVEDMATSIEFNIRKVYGAHHTPLMSATTPRLLKTQRPNKQCYWLVLEDMNQRTLGEIHKIQPKVIFVETAISSETKFAYPKLEEAGYRMLRQLPLLTVFFRPFTGICYKSGTLSPGSPEASKALNSKKWRNNDIISSTSTRIGSAPPATFLTPNRFDIAIKALYGRLRRDGLAPEWRTKAYEQQAIRITGPSKHIIEHDGSGKVGLHAFLSAFHSLLDEHSTVSLPLFPVSKNLIPLDGAHRIAAALVNKKRVDALFINSEYQMPSTVDYYSSYAHGHPPCPSDVIDEGIIEYCRIRKTAAIALIFPCVSKPEIAVEKLRTLGDIVARKDIILSPSAGAILLRQVYDGQSWLKNKSKTSGFQSKVDFCFPHKGEIRAILLDNYRPEKIRLVKENIRSIYGLGKHSIHITDSSEETEKLAKVIFNRNSIKHLKFAKNYALPNFHSMLNNFIDWIDNHQIDRDHVCIDGSAILSAFGIRECRDLDFIYSGSLNELPPPPDKTACHNIHFQKHSKRGIDETIGDPNHHFWYLGVKFCAPHVIIDLKQARNEPKDTQDIRLIRAQLGLSGNRLFNKSNQLLMSVLWAVQTQKHRFKTKAKNIYRKIKNG